MSKSLQQQLYEEHIKLAERLRIISSYVQNDFTIMFAEGSTNSQNIFEAAQHLEQDYQWLAMDLRSYASRIRAYLLYVAEHKQVPDEDISLKDAPHIRLFDQLTTPTPQPVDRVVNRINAHLDKNPGAREAQLNQQLDQLNKDLEAMTGPNTTGDLVHYDFDQEDNDEEEPFSEYDGDIW